MTDDVWYLLGSNFKHDFELLAVFGNKRSCGSTRRHHVTVLLWQCECDRQTHGHIALACRCMRGAVMNVKCTVLDAVTDR